MIARVVLPAALPALAAAWALGVPTTPLLRRVSTPVRSSDPCAHYGPGLAGPQRAGAGSTSASVRRQTVALRRAGRTRTLPLGRLVDPPWDACVRIDDMQSRGDTTYLLLWVSGSSRARPAQGQCAGGDETKLIYLAVGPRLAPVRQQAVFISSCLNNVDGPDDARFAGGVLRVPITASDSAGDRRFAVRYDRHAPESGLRVDTLDAGP